MSTSAPNTLLSPDPRPTKPRHTLPPGACDGHCHIFDAGDRFPYASGAA